MSSDEEMRRIISSMKRDVVACQEGLRTVEEFLVTHGAKVERLTPNEKDGTGALRRQVNELVDNMHELLNTVDCLDNA